MPQQNDLNKGSDAKPLGDLYRIKQSLENNPGDCSLVERVLIGIQSKEVRDEIERILNSYGIRKTALGTSSTNEVGADLLNKESSDMGLQYFFDLGVPVTVKEMFKRPANQSLTEFLLGVIKVKNLDLQRLDEQGVLTKFENAGGMVLKTQNEYSTQIKLTVEHQKWSFIITTTGSVIELFEMSGKTMAFVHSCREASKKSSN